jgi:Ca-activated chloride channel homolog
MSLVDSELQIASDTAARAAGRQFAVTQDLQAARDRGIQAGVLNKVGGKSLTLTNANITFGESALVTSGAMINSYSFTPKVVSQTTVGSTPGKIYVNAVDVQVSQTFTFSEMPMPIPLLSAPTGFTPRAESTSTQFDRDIVLVLDRSGSMNEYSTNIAAWTPAGPGEAYYGSRWRELVDAVRIFSIILNSTPQAEKIGLATFSDTASQDCPLGFSTTPVNAQMDAISANFLGGATAIGDGIGAGIAILSDPGSARPVARKTMIVMTDGIQNAGSDPSYQAQLAFNTYGIVVHTISFSDGADQTRMEEVALLGGGRHWHASNATQLQAAFAEIAKTLPTILTR